MHREVVFVGLVSTSLFSNMVDAAESAQPENPAGAETVSTAPPSERLKIGLRTGYALPIGDVYQDRPLADEFTGYIPIHLDVGYMVTPNLMLGVYGLFGIAQAPKCDGCSVSVTRFGIQAHYYISPEKFSNPWVGLGAGYEVASFELGETHGFEFAQLQGGIHLNTSSAFAIGPFFTFSLARYYYTPKPVFSNGPAPVGGSRPLETETVRIGNKTFHSWLTIGLMGTFSL